VKTSLNPTNHPSRSRHMPENLMGRLAGKRSTGEARPVDLCIVCTCSDRQVVKKVEGFFFFFFLSQCIVKKDMRQKDDGSRDTCVKQSMAMHVVRQREDVQSENKKGPLYMAVSGLLRVMQ
jgi:hypothetical protein